MKHKCKKYVYGYTANWIYKRTDMTISSDIYHDIWRQVMDPVWNTVSNQVLDIVENENRRSV